MIAKTRSIAITFLVWLAIVIWALVGCEIARGMAPLPQGFLPWPNHTEWSVFTVPSDGYLLCRPDSLNSSSMSCIDIPAGTEVYVPRVVPGAGPDTDQTQKSRETSR